VQPDVSIRQMQEGDVEGIVETFAEWHKRREQYQKYFAEQQQDQRIVLVALYKERIIGYVTVVWHSDYEPFSRLDIPEIVDLNVITEHQGQGVGTNLIRAAGQTALHRSKTRIGISVEQSPVYAIANHLYRKLGYVPDGKGITPHDSELHLVKEEAERQTG